MFYGFSLLEALVAMTLLGVTLVLAIGSLLPSLSLQKTATQAHHALILCENTMEQLVSLPLSEAKVWEPKVNSPNYAITLTWKTLDEPAPLEEANLTCQWKNQPLVRFTRWFEIN